MISVDFFLSLDREAEKDWIQNTVFRTPESVDGQREEQHPGPHQLQKQQEAPREGQGLRQGRKRRYKWDSFKLKCALFRLYLLYI